MVPYEPRASKLLDYAKLLWNPQKGVSFRKKFITISLCWLMHTLTLMLSGIYLLPMFPIILTNLILGQVSINIRSHFPPDVKANPLVEPPSQALSFLGKI